MFELIDFLKESNHIEGLDREIAHTEIEAAKSFLVLPKIDVSYLAAYVKAIVPTARLRDQRGLDVKVGNHRPLPGGPAIRSLLVGLLENASDLKLRTGLHAYRVHVAYETLHPFTDGNGRSGRLLWLWCMGGIDRAPLGFLHTFYYQALEASQ